MENAVAVKKTKEEVLAELAFPVEKRQLFCTRQDGMAKMVQNRMAVARTDNDEVVGIVSDRYKIINHGEVLDKPLDTLIAEGFEINGSYLHKFGSTVLVDLTSKFELDMLGEKFKMRIFLTNSYDATSSFRARLGIWRQICKNGMGTYDGVDGSASRVIHTGDAEVKKDYGQLIIAQKESFIQRFTNQMAALGGIKIGNDETAKAVIARLMVGEAAQKAIFEAYKMPINYSDTMYGIFNGVTYHFTQKDLNRTNKLTEVMHNEVFANSVVPTLLKVGEGLLVNGKVN